MYDVIIIGGGPAGLTAGIYSSRSKLDALLVERGIPGGTMMITERIENYPSLVEPISGPELAESMRLQAERFGLKFETAEVQSLDLSSAEKIVRTTKGDFKSRAVIIAVGAKYRTLNVPGERELSGRGVSYCATCDGWFFRDKKLAVVGGGDTAVEDACYLTKFATEVTIIHRRDKFRAAKMLQDRAFANPQIHVIWDTVVDEIVGDDVVTGLRLRNVKTGKVSELPVDGVFVLIGQDPDTAFLAGQVAVDEAGYILTDEDMHTNVPGVFAAGDARKKSFRQVVTACADGAIAANSADKYIEALKNS